MLNKEYPWSSQKEFYDVQSKDLFTHVEEIPFYHGSLIGQSGEEFVKYLIDEGSIDKQSRVIDMGCGTGYFVNKLSKFCYAEGISNSEECIKYAKLNFPDNIFKVEGMETYTGKNMTHCFFLESLFYSDVQNTFKNANKVLVDGGILFIKEWFDVSSNKYQTINKDHFSKYFVYYIQTVDKVVKIAENNGFRLIDSKDLSKIFNPIFYRKSIKYHYPGTFNYKEIFSKEEGGWPYIRPYQLKFKKQ
jgi:SAM-dependent methyltransferase